jgi:hypothetical protein
MVKGCLVGSTEIYVLYRNCHSWKLKAYYTRYCIILHKIKRGKKLYFSQLISLSDNKTKAMWNTVKTETRTKCHPATMPFVLQKDNLVNNPSQADEAFNSYFLILAQKLKLQDVQVDSAIPHLMRHNSNHYPIMPVIPVTVVEIIGIIGSLKYKNSSGYDGISNKILRSCGRVINFFLWLFFLIHSNMLPYSHFLRVVIYITLQITEQFHC